MMHGAYNVKEMEYVYCAVRTEYLNVIQIFFSRTALND